MTDDDIIAGTALVTDDDPIVVAVASAIVAAKGDGCNDAPLYCDYDELMRGVYRDIARYAMVVHIEALQNAGWILIPPVIGRVS